LTKATKRTVIAGANAAKQRAISSSAATPLPLSLAPGQPRTES
jgi:hypothetical protein